MTERSKTIAIIVGCICVLGGIIFWLTHDTKVPNSQGGAPPTVANRAITNSTLDESKDGKKTWTLKITSLTYDNKKENATMQGIEGTFYEEDGRTMTVTADEGTVNMKSKNIVLTKNPKGVTSDGGTVTADKITWLNKERLVVAEGHARITKGDVVAIAQKATMDVAIDKAKLEVEAKVTKGEMQP